MSDQFLGVQVSSGSPALIGPNMKGSVSPKQDGANEFLGVLLRAFLGEKVQGPSVKTDPTPGDTGDEGKEKNDETDKIDPSIVAVAAAVEVSLPVLVAVADTVELAATQVTQAGGQSEGSPLSGIQVTQGQTPGLESILSQMEPVKPETVDASAVPAEEQSGNGKLLSVDSQQESRREIQEPRLVYKLLKDLALGVFSSGSSESPAESPVENMVTFQHGKNMFASDIAQNIHSSTDKVASGPLLHSDSPVPEIVNESTPEKAGAQMVGSHSTSNPTGDVRNQTPVEAARVPAQEPVLRMQNEQIAQQPLAEELRVADPASSGTIPIAEPSRKPGESMQESTIDAKTVGVDHGAKQSDAPPLPQGVGVNAAASEHELNDSLTGKSYANVLHQQGIEPRQDANVGKDAVAFSKNPPPPLTPELAKSVLDQVMKGLAFQVQGNISEMRLSLKPESLGEMALKVRIEDGKLQAQIDVSQPAVKAIVETNLPQLRQELTNSGIDVQRIDVFAATQDSARESAGNRGDKPKHRGSRRSGTIVDAADPNQAVKMLGYNTMEVII